MGVIGKAALLSPRGPYKWITTFFQVLRHSTVTDYHRGLSVLLHTLETLSACCIGVLFQRIGHCTVLDRRATPTGVVFAPPHAWRLSGLD